MTEHLSSNLLIPTAVGSSVATGQQYSVEYLSQLLKDKKQLSAFPNVFHHLERLADEEISKVRVALFQFEFTKEEMSLPEPEGDIQITTEKVFVPAKEHPDYNFVGRILGPRGMTAKQLEQETGCKIMVRGRGSMRDKKKEELNRGKPNWEHLSEDLHVLIQCEDTPNRARVKLARAVEEVKKLLVPAPEGEDELKRKQLMELAIINGTYRSATEQAAAAAAAAQLKQPLAAALPLLFFDGFPYAMRTGYGYEDPKMSDSTFITEKKEKNSDIRSLYYSHVAENSFRISSISEAAALSAQARSVLPILAANNPALARSPTMAVAGAPIVMSPGRGAAGQQTQMLGLQSQLGAAVAVSSNAAAVAAQQAAILQQHQQQAAEYQQLLLSQGLSYENLANVAALQQFQQAQAQQAAAQQQYSLLGGQYSDYAGVDIAAAQTAPDTCTRCLPCCISVTVISAAIVITCFSEFNLISSAYFPSQHRLTLF
ncbi:KH domain protein [Necator americanus]|uniref:KH domain protein n=1 Tax=Necator americanus TaxID=51031 RepID=W2SKM6_NECAM|nr:KH domain protein [Necator americanus]ETN69406.1 KH domain protein [Necator americanus]